MTRRLKTGTAVTAHHAKSSKASVVHGMDIEMMPMPWKLPDLSNVHRL